MKPTVGRIVHYVSYGTPGGEYPSVCRAAMVTAAEHGDMANPVISLCVLNPEGIYLNRDVPFSFESRGGTWHWPEMVSEE